MLGWELQEGWWGGNYKRNAGTVITGRMVGRNYRRDGGAGIIGGMVGQEL